MTKQANEKLISEVLLRLYSVPKDVEYFKHVLSFLNGYICSDLAGYSFTNMDDGKLQRITSQGNFSAKVPDLNELDLIVQSHPFRQYYCTNQCDPVICTTDVMSEEEWKQTPFYNEIHRPIGVLHDTSVRFYFGRVCASFTFSDIRPMPSDKRRLLSLVAQHLPNAYRSVILQQKSWMVNRPELIVSLSPKGKLVDCSPAARALIDRYFPREKETVTWNLPDDMARWISLCLQNYFSHNAAGLGTKRLKITDSKRTLYMSLIHHACGYYVMLEESRCLDASEIFKRIGLTQREAEVLYWVVQGKQNSDVATILKIRLATVRKHMEHILNKLGCENRGTAAMMGMQAINAESSHTILLKCLDCTATECSTCPHLYS